MLCWCQLQDGLPVKVKVVESVEATLAGLSQAVSARAERGVAVVAAMAPKVGRPTVFAAALAARCDNLTSST